MLAPSPLLSIGMRARATLQVPGRELHAQIVAMLLDVASQHVQATTLIEQLCAAQLGKIAADHQESSDVKASAQARLEYARRVSRAEHRLPLSWPIEPLRCDVINSMADDEWTLMQRCLAGAGAEN